MPLCFICGEPRARGHKQCTHCQERNNAYMPSEEEIKAECIAIRMGWPEARMLREEMATAELETPVVAKATDHMRRRSDNRD